MFSPLKNIFWLTLHTASALAATIILTLPIADTLTEDTTSILKHLQTAAALYYQKKAAEAIRTYGYQPTTLWEAAVQDAIDTATQQPSTTTSTKGNLNSKNSPHTGAAPTVKEAPNT